MDRRDTAVRLRVITGLRDCCSSWKLTGTTSRRGAAGNRADFESRNLGIGSMRTASSAAEAAEGRDSSAAAAAG